MDQIEEEEFNNQPTIEEVKKIVDSRRQKDKIKRLPSKTYTKEDRIKNLEIARETKRNTIKNPKPEPEPELEPEPKSKPKSKPEPEPELKPINYNDMINDFKNILNENIEVILNKINTKKKREQKPRKPKTETRTLDLSITDDEIKNIISNNSITDMEKPKTKYENTDAKLKAFLDALTKK